MAENELKCPNCGEPVVAKAGGGCVCRQCGGTFTFVAGEQKLTDVGEFDRVKASIEAHERDIAELKKRLGSEPDDAPTDGDGPTDGPTANDDAGDGDDDEDDF